MTWNPMKCDAPKPFHDDLYKNDIKDVEIVHVKDETLFIGPVKIEVEIDLPVTNSVPQDLAPGDGSGTITNDDNLTTVWSDIPTDHSAITTPSETKVTTSALQLQHRKRAIPEAISSSINCPPVITPLDDGPSEPKKKKPKKKKKSAATKAKEKAKWRLAMSSEQKQLRLTKEKIRIATIRKNETADQRADRLAKARAYNKYVIKNETEQQRTNRLDKERIRKHLRRHGFVLGNAWRD